MYTTLKILTDNDACKEGLHVLLHNIGRKVKKTEKILFSDILESNGFDDFSWVIDSHAYPKKVDNIVKEFITKFCKYCSKKMNYDDSERITTGLNEFSFNPHDIFFVFQDIWLCDEMEEDRKALKYLRRLLLKMEREHGFR